MNLSFAKLESSGSSPRSGRGATSGYLDRPLKVHQTETAKEGRKKVIKSYFSRSFGRRRQGPRTSSNSSIRRQKQSQLRVEKGFYLGAWETKIEGKESNNKKNCRGTRAASSSGKRARRNSGHSACGGKIGRSYHHQTEPDTRKKENQNTVSSRSSYWDSPQAQKNKMTEERKRFSGE